MAIQTRQSIGRKVALMTFLKLIEKNRNDDMFHIHFNAIVSRVCPYLLISGYFEGIVRNLEAMPVYYPGWVMRLYHDFDDDDRIAKVV